MPNYRIVIHFDDGGLLITDFTGNLAKCERKIENLLNKKLFVNNIDGHINYFLTSKINRFQLEEI